MAEKTNTPPPQQPQATSAGQPQGSKTEHSNTLNVSQFKADTLTVKQLLKQKKELEANQHRSPEQDDLLNKINKELDNRPDEGNTFETNFKPDLAEDKGPDEKTKPKGPFVQKPILDYLFDDLFMDDILNGSYKWTYEHVMEPVLTRVSYKGTQYAGKALAAPFKGGWKLGAWIGKKASNYISGSSQQSQNPQQGTPQQSNPQQQGTPQQTQTSQARVDNPMLNRLRGIDNHFNSYIQNNINDSIRGGAQELNATMDRIVNGQATPEDSKSAAYAILKGKGVIDSNGNIDPQKKKNVEQYKKVSLIVADQTATFMALGAMFVRAKYAQRALEEKNPRSVSGAIQREETYLMALVIAKNVKSAQNPQKYIKDLSEDLTKANETCNLSVQQGKYQANGKKPIKNEVLNDIYQRLGLNKSGELDIARTHQFNNTQPRQLDEALIFEQKQRYSLRQREENINTSDSSLDSREANMAQRRAYLEQYKKHIGVTYIVEMPRDNTASPTEKPIYNMAIKLYGGR